MNTIWKYQLEICDEQYLQIPSGAKILTVQIQQETVQLWACVDLDLTPVLRQIRIHGTGHNVPNHDKLKYISTFQLQDGNLVFHVFEVLE